MTAGTAVGATEVFSYQGRNKDYCGIEDYSLFTMKLTNVLFYAHCSIVYSFSLREQVQQRFPLLEHIARP